MWSGPRCFHVGPWSVFQQTQSVQYQRPQGFRWAQHRGKLPRQMPSNGLARPIARGLQCVSVCVALRFVASRACKANCARAFVDMPHAMQWICDMNETTLKLVVALILLVHVAERVCLCCVAQRYNINVRKDSRLGRDILRPVSQVHWQELNRLLCWLGYAHGGPRCPAIPTI